MELERLLRYDVSEPDHERNKKAIMARLVDVRQEPAHPALLRISRWAAVLGIAVAAFVFDAGTQHRQPESAVAAEVPFTLEKSAQGVLLTWSGEASAYRILKGSSPAALKEIQTVKAQKWLDPYSPADSPITFYRVIPL